ncbi:hypothetical protein Pth03_04690 [Planotetraspora thailandica]|uniref:Uncharacterized protein n=1 Tax=Planotetraspora thailandica TaxID=487172 RepID=A0A8J3V8N4_9ACTN|nr:hypothetical protein Pth03_04690 [Planotetraspora thailandica]
MGARGHSGHWQKEAPHDGPKTPLVRSARGELITDNISPECADHISFWDPDWALADIASKRKILERAAAVVDQSEREPAARAVWAAYRSVLRDIALPFADRPDCPAELRPASPG